MNVYCTHAGSRSSAQGLGEDPAETKKFYINLTANGLFNEYYLDCSMQHGLRDPNNGNFFGLTCSTCNTVTAGNKYIMERSVTFCQAIITGLIYNTTYKPNVNRFIDCENYRFGWNPDSYCSNGSNCDQ